jgi:hypothetical protein
MSNATAVIIDFVVWRVRDRKEAGEEDVRLEQTIDLIADAETDEQGANASFAAEEEGPLAQYEKRRRLGKRVVETTAVEGSRSRGRRTAAQVADEAIAKAIQL